MLSGMMSGCVGNPPDVAPKWNPEKRAEAHVALGMDYLRRAQYEVAREEFDLAISIDPDSDRAYHGKALLLAQTGYDQEAREGFARAVRINASNYVAVNDYGIFLCQQGDHASGLAVLERIKDRPDSRVRATTWLGIGICHHGARQWDSAKEYLRRALEVNPRLPQALEPMAEITYSEQNFLSARAFVERYVATGAITENILTIGAKTELQLGDGEKARQYVAELRRRYPESSQLATLSNLVGSQAQ